MFYIRDNYKAKSHSGTKKKYCCRLLLVSITERMIKTKSRFQTIFEIRKIRMELGN